MKNFSIYRIVCNVLSSEMDPAEITFKFDRSCEARRFWENSARPPCFESPLKLQNEQSRTAVGYLETNYQRYTDLPAAAYLLHTAVGNGTMNDLRYWQQCCKPQGVGPARLQPGLARSSLIFRWKWTQPDLKLAVWSFKEIELSRHSSAKPAKV